MTLTEILDVQPFHTVYQPIRRLADEELLGLEALTRFRIDPRKDSGHWFEQAALHGHTINLEHAVLRRAIPEIHNLPEHAFLAINLSPSTLISGGLIPVLASIPLERLVVEITEHEAVPDYEVLRDALQPLRGAGLKLAIDDLGAGFSSLRHVLRLEPEIIKLDSHMIRRVETNPTAASMVAALVAFSRDSGSLLVAEGIETDGEYQRLKELGVPAGQGHYLGTPDTGIARAGAVPHGLSDYRRSLRVSSPR